MALSPNARKLSLAVHVTTSVGWVGAVAVFLALALIGMTSSEVQTRRAAYLVMQPAAWFALLPMAVASLLTGVVQSLGTAWGLARHYWVLLKLGITVVANLVLVVYMQTFARMAAAAADPATSQATLGAMGSSPVLHAGLALLMLLAASALGIYKPRGMTRYGRRRQARPVW